MSTTYTVLDLFAGCGGMSRGFVDAGFSIVGGVENNLHAAATYAANFGESVTHYTDISEFQSVPKADVVIGGPPCQGFSNLGRRDPSDLRNKLWGEFVRVLVAADCDVFAMENVDRFAKSVECGLLRQETSAGGRLADYELEVLTLNAADFGVAQRRVRTIILGTRIGPLQAPRHTHDRLATQGADAWRTLRDVIGDLEFDGLPTLLPKKSGTWFDEAVPGDYKLSDIHVDRNYRPKSLERYTLIPPGGNRFLLPERLQYQCWKDHTSGAGDVLGRLEWDKPAVTIRTEFHKPEKGRYLHPEWSEDGVKVNRALTLAEAALLQGFDDSHVWCGSKIQIARQIGNAVPPPLANSVAKTIAARLRASHVAGPARKRLPAVLAT